MRRAFKQGRDVHLYKSTYQNSFGGWKMAQYMTVYRHGGRVVQGEPKLRVELAVQDALAILAKFANVEVGIHRLREQRADLHEPAPRTRLRYDPIPRETLSRRSSAA